ncbi:MAG: hypothetical protein A2W73_07420 [Deltaproteobacteria bacterium RIFCSPLOWO2_12_55_13]|nr:MAG: hypothetical protein A2X89_10800 [Deltaproteobacteria bacterium GWD2_55_8]OGQ63593.1 MAG: hypothetical protein A2W73_07420 [Deltaproteobacteria bacterium RIFCSPLOWO2_12_55_13]OGQ93351.1 MAG: hypothetical protein A2253_02325 [Deltaproteobacteria bacterium RIFOXYA2_FULL_55_11]HBA38453.1 hypothetical protein [Deltaproteobacteria bacterium]
MSIIDDVKSVAQLIQQIDNVELYRKILDLQGEVMGLVQENSELRKEISYLSQVPGRDVVRHAHHPEETRRADHQLHRPARSN